VDLKFSPVEARIEIAVPIAVPDFSRLVAGRVSCPASHSRTWWRSGREAGGPARILQPPPTMMESYHDWRFLLFLSERAVARFCLGHASVAWVRAASIATRANRNNRFSRKMIVGSGKNGRWLN